MHPKLFLSVADYSSWGHDCLKPSLDLRRRSFIPVHFKRRIFNDISVWASRAAERGSGGWAYACPAPLARPSYDKWFPIFIFSSFSKSVSLQIQLKSRMQNFPSYILRYRNNYWSWTYLYLSLINKEFSVVYSFNWLYRVGVNLVKQRVLWSFMYVCKSLNVTRSSRAIMTLGSYH